MIDDVYVQILKYVKEKSNGKITRQELQNQFPDQWDLINREIQNNRLFSPLTSPFESDQTFSLSFEDNFRLMEYEELVEARKSAKFAFWIAIISIGLNIAALMYSILNTPSVHVTNLQEIVKQSEKNK